MRRGTKRHDKALVNNKLSGAGRGTRTPTTLSGLRILSPLRLPVPPSRRGKRVKKSHSCGIAARFQSRTVAVQPPNKAQKELEELHAELR